MVHRFKCKEAALVVCQNVLLPKNAILCGALYSITHQRTSLKKQRGRNSEEYKKNLLSVPTGTAWT